MMVYQKLASKAQQSLEKRTKLKSKIFFPFLKLQSSTEKRNDFFERCPIFYNILKMIRIDAASVGQLIIGCVLGIELLLCIAILVSNSSGPSLFMTLFRILSVIVGVLFLMSTIDRIKSFEAEKWGKLVWILFGAAMLCSILSISTMEYYSFNPSHECFVSPSAVGALARMDILSLTSYAVLMWYYHQVNKNKPASSE